jgi:hypothetical protein
MVSTLTGGGFKWLSTAALKAERKRSIFLDMNMQLPEEQLVGSSEGRARAPKEHIATAWKGKEDQADGEE